jgi:hypothetical protein
MGAAGVPVSISLMRDRQAILKGEVSGPLLRLSIFHPMSASDLGLATPDEMKVRSHAKKRHNDKIRQAKGYPYYFLDLKELRSFLLEILFAPPSFYIQTPLRPRTGDRFCSRDV